MPTFPTLSREMQWNSEEDREDATIKSPFEDGYVHTRPRYTRQRWIWSNIKYEHLNLTDAQNLRSFITEVRGTSEIFVWSNPNTGVPHNVRFKEIPKIIVEVPGHYFGFTMTLEEV